MSEQKLRIKEKELTDEERKRIYEDAKRVSSNYKNTSNIEIIKIPEENIRDEIIKETLVEKEIDRVEKISGEIIDESQALANVREKPKNIAAVLKELLDTPITDEQAMANNLPVNYPRKYIMAVKMIQMAEQGDLGAMKVLLDRTEGRVPNENRSQTLKVSANSEQVKEFLELINGSNKS